MEWIIPAVLLILIVLGFVFRRKNNGGASHPSRSDYTPGDHYRGRGGPGFGSRD